jgi:hydroxymethylbilane synthase
LPAPGQGSLAIECRANDAVTLAALASLNDPQTRAAVVAERTLLAVLEGGCSAPVAAWGRAANGELKLDGLVASLDGCQVLRASGESKPDDADALGARIANELLQQGAAAIVSAAQNG